MTDDTTGTETAGEACGKRGLIRCLLGLFIAAIDDLAAMRKEGKW